MRPTVINRLPRYEGAQHRLGHDVRGFRTNDDLPDVPARRPLHVPFWTQTPNASLLQPRHRARPGVYDGRPPQHAVRHLGRGRQKVTCLRVQAQERAAAVRSSSTEPNTNDWRPLALRDRAHNGWGLDRQSQRDGTQYTGIGNITIQDRAVTESMGPITDHDWEHLAPTDQMIARTRRRLLLAARAYRDSGELPPGAATRTPSWAHAPAPSCSPPTRRWNRLTRRNWKRRCAGRRSPRSGHEGEVRSVRWEAGTSLGFRLEPLPGAPGAATAGARRRGAASWPHPQLFPAERPPGRTALRDRRAAGSPAAARATSTRNGVPGSWWRSRNRATFRWRNSAHTVLVAGGIGITPMLSMIARLQRLGSSWGLHYAVRTGPDAAFLDQLAAFAQVHVTIDDEPARRGSTCSACSARWRPPFALLLQTRRHAGRVPRAWRPWASAALRYFSADTQPAYRGGYRLELQRSEQDPRVKAGETMLDALLNAGVDVGFACTEGVCGSCRVPVLHGVPDHRDVFLTGRTRCERRRDGVLFRGHAPRPLPRTSRWTCRPATKAPCFGFHGRTALVTSAAAGGGRGDRPPVPASGARVAVSDIDEQAARQLADRTDVPASRWLTLDVHQQTGVQGCGTASPAHRAITDIVVNNAGYAKAHAGTDSTGSSTTSWQSTAASSPLQLRGLCRFYALNGWGHRQHHFAGRAELTARSRRHLRGSQGGATMHRRVLRTAASQAQRHRQRHRAGPDLHGQGAAVAGTDRAHREAGADRPIRRKPEFARRGGATGVRPGRVLRRGDSGHERRALHALRKAGFSFPPYSDS